jgi:phosphatidylglycerophosphatase A
MIKPFLIFASVGGVGFSPKAPGTAGSLVGLIALILCLKEDVEFYSLWVILGLLFILGWLSSHRLLKGSYYQDSDPSYIVIDEIAGMWLTVLLLLTFNFPSWPLYGLSFIAFRIFDIFKPWPIGWIDEAFAKHQSMAALGIMVDDIVAGFMAALSVEVLTRLSRHILNYSIL